MKDVLDFSWFAGSLQQPWQRLLQARAAEQHADQIGQQPDLDSLQSRSEEFRYQRDLLSAEETETWLTERDIDEDGFSAYFVRTYWLEQIQPPPEGVASDLASADPELLELLRIDLLLSGEFDRLAQNFSWHVAALRAAEPAPDVVEQAWSRFEKRTGVDRAILPNVLDRLGRDRDWFEHCLLLDEAFARISSQWLNPSERARALASRRYGLTRVQIEGFAAPSQDAAEEAVLCLRENSVSLSELAQACGSTRQQRECFLEDFDPAIQQILLCASPGEVMHLPQDESGFLVCLIRSKLDPDLSQPEVESRIDQRLLQTRFSDLTRQHVQWVTRPHE